MASVKKRCLTVPQNKLWFSWSFLQLLLGSCSAPGIILVSEWFQLLSSAHRRTSRAAAGVVHMCAMRAFSAHLGNSAFALFLYFVTRRRQSSLFLDEISGLYFTKQEEFCYSVWFMWNHFLLNFYSNKSGLNTKRNF